MYETLDCKLVYEGHESWKQFFSHNRNSHLLLWNSKMLEWVGSIFQVVRWLGENVLSFLVVCYHFTDFRKIDAIIGFVKLFPLGHPVSKSRDIRRTTSHHYTMGTSYLSLLVLQNPHMTVSLQKCFVFNSCFVLQPRCELRSRAFLIVLNKTV